MCVVLLIMFFAEVFGKELHPPLVQVGFTTAKKIEYTHIFNEKPVQGSSKI